MSTRRAQGVDLRAVGLAAVDGEDAHAHAFAVFGDRVGDLQGEFARGREDERLRIFLRGEVVEDGEGEGGGLAGAGLRLADDVGAGEHEGDHARLDGRRFGVAKFGDGLENLLAEI
ncbi:MAG: hypothetical protein M5U11_02305 [Anaerolineales bacterium]|nr:hypothetical protein [Anaerolineales bacterium]